MPPEPITLISIILKYVWVPLVAALAYLFKRQDKIREEMYTKVETKEYVDSQLTPILVELRHHKELRQENTEAMKELTTVLTDLRIENAKRRDNRV